MIATMDLSVYKLSPDIPLMRGQIRISSRMAYIIRCNSDVCNPCLMTFNGCIELFQCGHIYLCTISTRETLSAARLVADGWSSLEAMELTFLPLFEGTRTEWGERNGCKDLYD